MPAVGLVLPPPADHVDSLIHAGDDLLDRPRSDDPKIDAALAKGFAVGAGPMGVHDRYEDQLDRINAISMNKAAFDVASAKYDTSLNLVDAAGNYQPDRARLHEDILDEFFAKYADVPDDGRMLMTGGLGGSGKTTLLGRHGGPDELDLTFGADGKINSHVVVNPDDFKEVLFDRGAVPKVPGWMPGEASTFVHEEASHLANLAAARAIAEHKNVLWDFTMASRSSIDNRFRAPTAKGYTVDAMYVDTTVGSSKASAEKRHEGGYEKFTAAGGTTFGARFVPDGNYDRATPPPDSPYRSNNRAAFESWKADVGHDVGTLVIDNEDWANRVVSNDLTVNDADAAKRKQAGLAAGRDGLVDRPVHRAGNQVGVVGPGQLVERARLGERAGVRRGPRRLGRVAGLGLPPHGEKGVE